LTAANQLVELDLYRQRVLVLRALDQEHHEKRDDRRSGVDDELPGVGEMKERAAYEPHTDDEEREAEGPGTPGPSRDPRRELLETMAELIVSRP
jgi:hypothetical protein